MLPRKNNVVVLIISPVDTYRTYCFLYLIYSVLTKFILCIVFCMMSLFMPHTCDIYTRARCVSFVLCKLQTNLYNTIYTQTTAQINYNHNNDKSSYHWNSHPTRQPYFWREESPTCLARPVSRPRPSLPNIPVLTDVYYLR